MKTNIKMWVTPEQSAKVQEICFANNVAWSHNGRNVLSIESNMLSIEGKRLWILKDECTFERSALKEVDPDLFIRTNGKCEEDEIDELVKKSDSRPQQYQIGIDTFERMRANASFDEIVGACKLNVDKYIWRAKGCDKQDLLKAKDYIELWLWAIENKETK